ncbi:MAG TPA: sigma-70 family RNA polymerase sigma factor, partial [Candidatus Angelobacter sp.]|nr:sigma-70 family RNA polymerase sigma factor [Candidatus Angelobacter sp.]
YKPFVRDLARFFSRQTFLASDLADNMLAELFLPDRSGNSRILSYDGRSSLCTWLRVVLSNRAINLRRGKAYARTDDLEGSIPERTTFVNFDQMVRAARYRDRLTDAMKRALAQLASQERLLLLWRYEDGLQLGQIARLLGIHPSNVGRRLQRLHGKLRDRIVANLATQHGLSGPAIAECLLDMIENPYHDVSILEALQSAELDLTSV